MTALTDRDGSQWKHWRDLPPRCVHVLAASHIHAMLTGASALTQNRKGLVTITYQNGVKEPVQFGDINLIDHDDFLKAFRLVWLRKETGA